MAGPPTDIPASALFRKLCETPRPTEVIDFPRRMENGEPYGRVRIQVLTAMEHDAAREKVHRAYKDRQFSSEELSGMLMREVVGDAVAREILAMACLAEEGVDLDGGSGKLTYPRIFKDANDLRMLRPDEVAVLFNAYMLTQAKYGPFERNVTTKEDVTAWIKRLEEGASEYPLLRLPLPALAGLAFSLARRAYLLSAILESQWSSLPDSSRWLLAGCSMGTGFYGAPPADSTDTGGESSDEGLPVTTALAARATLKLREQDE